MKRGQMGKRTNEKRTNEKKTNERGKVDKREKTNGKDDCDRRESHWRILKCTREMAKSRISQ